MAKSLLLAWSSPTSDESLGEFEDWYENTHIPQVREAIPSITEVTRYALVDPASPEKGDRFLAVYEMDADDVAAAAAALGEAGKSGRLDMTTTMDVKENPPVLQWYRRTSS